MYLVVSFGGQWDDAWHQNEWSTLDKVKADQHLVECIEAQDLHNSIVDKIDTLRFSYADRVGPCASVLGWQDYPRWPAGIAQTAITEAMRNERDYIQANNARIQEENIVLSQAYDDACDKEIVEFLMSLGFKEGDHLMNSYAQRTMDANFRIEEVPFGG